MSQWIYLSHILNEETPSYGNRDNIEIESVYSIDKGDTCNTSLWKIPNHLGTHIDFPKHFLNSGRSVDDYAASFWFIRDVYVLHIKRKTESKMIIDLDDFKNEKIPHNTNFLIVRTGFYSLRKTSTYWNSNPVFLPEIADFLRENYTNIKIMGFDTISLSSWTNRLIGRKAHNSFLNHQHPILLLEDMDLSLVKPGIEIKNVFIGPLRVSKADGSPCTVIAEI